MSESEDSQKPLKWYQIVMLILAFIVGSCLFVAWLLYQLFSSPHPFGG